MGKRLCLLALLMIATDYVTIDYLPKTAEMWLNICYLLYMLKETSFGGVGVWGWVCVCVGGGVCVCVCFFLFLPKMTIDYKNNHVI